VKVKLESHWAFWLPLGFRVPKLFFYPIDVTHNRCDESSQQEVANPSNGRTCFMVLSRGMSDTRPHYHRFTCPIRERYVMEELIRERCVGEGPIRKQTVRKGESQKPRNQCKHQQLCVNFLSRDQFCCVDGLKSEPPRALSLRIG